MKSIDRRNKYCFGLGTVGRDMFYTMVSMYLMTYLTEVLQLSDKTLLMMTTMLLYCASSTPSTTRSWE